MRFRLYSISAVALIVAACAEPPVTPEPSLSSANRVASASSAGINVVLTGAATADRLAALGQYGTVLNVFADINAVTMRASASALSQIKALPFVQDANFDAQRNGSPVDAVAVADFTSGLNTWDQDAVNVTSGPGFATRDVTQTGDGVYVAILDTGLLDSWRQYFPQERIAEEYGIAFSGGGADMGNVTSTPNAWEHDQDSHGTHVTSSVLGYSLNGTPVGGVAPMATVIPVKVLNNHGSGWSSVIAQGILYVASLKEGPLAGHPVVINMSLGGGALDALEKAAIDYAIAHGVIVVAAAGNAGNAGMDYPGAYGPVISAAAAGWAGQWTTSSWWYSRDVADPTNPADFYIPGFSSRQKTGQDLDVAAPGVWVVGPYQVQSGKTSYYYLSGTSMATPHVTGVVALMAEKDPSLTASQAETILESTAVPMGAGSRTVLVPGGSATYSWGTNATGAGLVDAVAALAATP
jgi:Subtilase family